jgi:hypothetical protein
MMKMKIAKLSLAAAVALGTVTNVAVAKDLSEAIKNVDVSGLIRYELQQKRSDGLNGNKGSNNNHDYEIDLTFKVPLTSEVTAVVKTELDGNTDTTNKAKYFSDDKLHVDEMYGIYKPSGTPLTLKYGNYNLGFTPFSDGDLQANGTTILYSPTKEVTLAAFYYDAHNDSEVGLYYEDSDDKKIYFSTKGEKTVEDSHVYGGALMVNSGPYGGDFWYLGVTDALSIWTAKLSAMPTFGDVSVGVKAEYRASSMDGEFEKANPLFRLQDGTHWALSSSVAASGWKLWGAYGVAEADDAASGVSGVSALTLDPGSDLVNADQVAPEWLHKVEGEETKYSIGLNFPTLSGFKPSVYHTAFERDYAEVDKENYTVEEYVVKLGYNFTKNFDVDTYYAFGEVEHYNGETGTGKDAKFDKTDFEIEFDYKF